MTDRILLKKHLREIVPFSDPTIRQMEAEGNFPKRFPINPNGGKYVGWRESEVQAWIAERQAA